MSKEKTEFESIVTPVFRASYAAVFQPSLPKNETDEKKAKYGVTMIFDLKDPEVLKGLAEMEALAMRTGKKEWGDDLSKWPHIEHKLFKMGDTDICKEKDGSWKPGYGPNTKYCKAQSSLYKKNGEKRMPPQIVDAWGKPIIEPNQFYSGCYARAKIACGTYEYMGKHGINFYLMTLRKEADGTPFVAKHNAADDFKGCPTPATPPAGATAAAAKGGEIPF